MSREGLKIGGGFYRERGRLARASGATRNIRIQDDDSKRLPRAGEPPTPPGEITPLVGRR